MIRSREKVASGLITCGISYANCLGHFFMVNEFTLIELYTLTDKGNINDSTPAFLFIILVTLVYLFVLARCI